MTGDRTEAGTGGTCLGLEQPDTEAGEGYLTGKRSDRDPKDPTEM